MKKYTNTLLQNQFYTTKSIVFGFETTNEGKDIGREIQPNERAEIKSVERLEFSTDAGETWEEINNYIKPKGGF